MVDFYGYMVVAALFELLEVAHSVRLKLFFLNSNNFCGC